MDPPLLVAPARLEHCRFSVDRIITITDSTGMAKRKIALSTSIDPDLWKRFHSATEGSASPFAPSKVQVIERGLELALDELERERHHPKAQAKQR